MDKLRVLGEYFGFPKCCIDQFCTNHKEDRSIRNQAGKNTGFIPCTRHAVQINSGQMRLEELIENRQHKVPFPQSNVKQTIEEFPHLFRTP